MIRRNFKDSRGDEYTFTLYSTNDVKITKRRGDGIHFVELSSDAVEQLKDLLEEEHEGM